jgi:hypothetical protein
MRLTACSRGPARVLVRAMKEGLKRELAELLPIYPRI